MKSKKDKIKEIKRMSREVNDFSNRKQGPHKNKINKYEEVLEDEDNNGEEIGWFFDEV